MLKAQRLVAVQAAAESRVRLAPAPLAEDALLAVAIDRRIQEELAERVTAEAKAVHVDGPTAGPAWWPAVLPPATPPTSDEDAKSVDAGSVLRLDPGLAEAIRREREIADAFADVKAVNVGLLTPGVLTAAVEMVATQPYRPIEPDPISPRQAAALGIPVDAVPDPLPLPPVPATNPIRVAASVPGMRFTWQLDELTRPIPRQEP